jgi:hypothetical protein
MKKRLGFIVGLIFTGTAPHGLACSLAPDYLPGEFGSSNVQLGDLTEASDKILIGRLLDEGHQKPPILKVSKSLKPSRKWVYKRTVPISFLDTKNFHSMDNLDDSAFTSIRDVQSYLHLFKNNSSAVDTHNFARGYGGPMAGIGHGSDCERMVFSFSKQDYLTFLDKDNMVLGLLPIDQTKIGNLATLISEFD